ncbi:MAG: urease accessory protein UreD [Dehalococcoidia bacterium]
MRPSRARLLVDAPRGRARMLASAAVPQRWASTRIAHDGWVEAVHQAVGDGVFAGDEHRTHIEARGAALLVRGLTATPLRRGRAATVTRLVARQGGTLVHLPGPLLPQVDADHVNALRVDVDATSRMLAASIVTPGRTGMGERGRFARLRVRTVARVAGALAFAEDASIEPATVPLDGPAVFDGAGAALSLLALGDWPLADPAWWRDVLPAEARGGASRLRTGGVCVRLLLPTLGGALAFIDVVEAAVRANGRDGAMPSVMREVALKDR